MAVVQVQDEGRGGSSAAAIFSVSVCGWKISVMAVVQVQDEGRGGRSASAASSVSVRG